MSFQSWFNSKPAWFRGGIGGVVVCLLLAVFYLTVYNALLKMVFPDGMLPAYSLFLPIATGHFFIFVSHFIAEGYVAPLFGCVAENAACFERVEWITLLFAAALLLGIYFAIGALIGRYTRKRETT